MAEENQVQEVAKGPRKRNIGHKKGKGKKRMRVSQGSGQKVKMDAKTKKLFWKRARDYNSDDSEDANDVEEEEEEPAPVMKFEKKQLQNENKKGVMKFEKKQLQNENKERVMKFEKKQLNENKKGVMKFEKKQLQNENEEGDEDEDEDDDEDGDADMDDEVSDDEDVEIQSGVMKFSEGCTAFKKAFKKIIKRTGSDDVLGPVLSAYKKLVVSKLAAEEAEKKVKGDARKEKYLLGEKGHVKPDTFSVTHEKLLIGVATKGVVKLFNAVNKAQNSQKGLNPSRSKDAKVIQKRRKEAFFSELGKAPSSAKVSTSANEEGPAWAPLRDNYMLTNSKLKDWDKAADAPVSTDDFERSQDSSSDDEDE